MTTDAPRSDSPPDPSTSSQHRINVLADHGWTIDRILGTFPAASRPAVARYLVQRGEVLDSPPEPYYGFRFPETDGDVTMMDRVSPYPPEFVASFFKTERCLIARAFQPPKVYQPCTDMLPRTMAWLAAGVPMDFIDRVDSRLAGAEELPVFLTAVEGDAAIERAGISGFDMAQVPDPS